MLSPFPEFAAGNGLVRRRDRQKALVYGAFWLKTALYGAKMGVHPPHMGDSYHEFCCGGSRAPYNALSYRTIPYNGRFVPRAGPGGVGDRSAG